jgi:NADH-quinone oxidoreductase subunit G
LPDIGQVKDSWKFLSEMIKIFGSNKDQKWEHFDDIVTSFTESYPFFIKVKEDIPDSGFRYFNEKIARQASRFSGRTSMNANVSVSEPKPPQDDDSPLVFSMEGYKGQSSSYFVPYYWSPGWNSVQAMNKYMDQPDGSLKDGNPGVLLFGKQIDPLPDFFRNIPDPFTPEKGKLLVVPVYLFFGSEELSSNGRSISPLIPEQLILINEKERNGLRITEDDAIKLTINKININAIIKTDNTIPDGIAGLALISGRTPYLDLPEWGIIESGDTN